MKGLIISWLWLWLWFNAIFYYVSLREDQLGRAEPSLDLLFAADSTPAVSEFRKKECRDAESISGAPLEEIAQE